MRGDGDFCFLSKFFGFIFIVFAVLLCPAVLSPSYIQQAYQKKKRMTLPGVCTYVRHVSEHSEQNRPHRETYEACELFFFWSMAAGRLALSSRQFATTIMRKLCSIMDLCPLRLI